MTTTAPSARRAPAGPHSAPGGAPGRGRERLTGALSLLALAALLLGLPALLAVLVGWPLPHRVPTGAELADVARSPITDRMLVDALACVFWLAWLQIVVCTAVEVRAAVTGVGVPRTLPLAGVTQHLTRRLVSSVLLLATATAVLTPVTAAATRGLQDGAPERAATGVSAPLQDGLAPAAATPVPAAAGAAATLAAADPADRTRLAGELAGRKVLVVEPPEGRHHMSLWEIAELHLGDGRRYAEVFALNEGRVQPDGRTLLKARLIQPGWQLVLPDDAVGVPTVPLPAAAPAAPAGGPAPGSQAPAQAPAQDPAAPAVSALPATGPAASAGAGSGATAGPAAPLDAESGLAQLLYVAEAGLLSAGLLTALGRLRRVQQRRRAEGARLPVPAAALVRAEVALRLDEDPEQVRALDTALRLLSERQAAAGRPLPDVVAAVVTPDVVRLVLAAPTRPVPAPFTAADPAGGSWQAPRAELAATGSSPALSPYPALVSLGRDEDGSTLLVDLEAVGVLQLSGPRRRTTAVLRALAVELATSGWADHLRLTLVGFGEELAPLQPERVRCVATLAQALPGLEARAARHGGAQQAQEVLRSRTPGSDPLLPEIVLLAEQVAPGSQELARLQALAAGLAGRSGLALVTAEDVPAARWGLRADAAGAAVVQPLGAGLTSRGLDDEAWRAVTGLVAQAAAAPAAVPDVAGAGGPDLSPDGAPAPAARLPRLADVVDAGPAAPPAVRLALVPEPAAAAVPADRPVPAVRLLGPVEVVVPGCATAPHPHCAELVVLLALHPEGLALPAVAAALSPREEPAQAQRAVQVLLARTRSWLGTDDAGQERLPRAAAGEPLRLGPDLRTDREAFRAAAATGRLDDGALALLRGRPLTGLAPRRWAWLATTGLEQELPADVTDAVLREVRARRAAGDLAGVVTAAAAGLRSEPLDERLWRELLRAEADRSDLGRVAALADELRALVERELSPYDDVQPETEALLDTLLPARERAAR